MTSPSQPLDARRTALKAGVAQLNGESLGRLRTHIAKGRPLVLDEVHYDSKSRSWCAFAVALDVPAIAVDRAINPSDLKEEDVVELIQSVGSTALGNFSINPMSGIPGEFFRGSRYDDLAQIVSEVSVERGGV